MKARKNKAQSFLEYGVLIAVVAIALIVIRTYFVRSVQEKYRQSADVFGEGGQYVKGTTKVTEESSYLDISGTGDSRDTCPSVTARVAGLEREIQGYDTVEAGVTTHFKGLLERADFFAAQATQMRQQAGVSSSAGFGDAGPQEAQLIEMAADFENQALACRQEAADKQDRIDQLKTEYADCF